MGKLIKIVVVLALVAGGVALAVHYAGGSGGNQDAAASDTTDQPNDTGQKDKLQLQEKYGFAPVDDGG